MIQRIQSVYLVAATALVGLLFFFPFSVCVDVLNEETSVKASSYPLVILQTIVFVILVITLCMYKRRMLQIRFCVFNIVALLGYQGVALYMAMREVCSYQITLVFPLVAAILIFLALRAITKDEALVRSLDRLR
ncbi:MAG: DUF4293 domain-containing protein [Prevotellaceae bacterium]|jgi:hypothetical protein|nr:DUF4293 domain-containing protein [Prevotellaceae bacterium]